MLLTARTPSRYASALAALSVFMAALLLPLSFTGGVMTTPAIQQSLGGSPAALSWLTNGFMLTFGSFLLAAGVTADAIDRKRIFIAGAALFCLSSLLFCLTHNLFLSGVLRALQGLAAAMILASGSAVLAQLYDGAQRTRAFCILGTVFGAGLAFGPRLFIADHAGLVHRVGGTVRGVCRALPEGEQPGAGTLPAAPSAFCRRTVAACRHLLLLRGPADCCSTAFYGRRGDE